MHPGIVGALALASRLVALAGAWGAAALWFKAPRRGRAYAWLLGVWLLWCGAVLSGLWGGRALTALLAYLAAHALLLGWWRTLLPSNERAWADDVARTGWAEVDGDAVRLHEVRNFDWRSRTDYTARWETRRYDLARLATLDLITSHWTYRSVAHVLLSFGFAGGEQLVFSVEIRRARDQRFSELGGFFKEFELSVVAADERDIIRVRTNVRGEDDYLFHVRLPRARMRSLFLAYLAQMNALAHTPRFYNTVTVNCTTLVYQMMRHIDGRLPLDYRLLLSGYLPEYLYAVGGLDARYSLAELRRFGRITERARLAEPSADFSRAIRSGIPPLEDAQPG